MISAIITTFNEGEEVKRTIESVRENTSEQYEIILVDDASTDGSCKNVEADKKITHTKRVGIAYSRIVGVTQAEGDTYAFLDAHQRVSKNCLNLCSELALEKEAIVWPDVCGLGESRWMGHGACMCQKDGRKEGLFEGRWRRTKPKDPITRSLTMIVPGYCIPKSVWPKVKLIEELRGHGASEPAITVRAFFAEVDILHLCGPLARHLFREGTRLPYDCRWRTSARNHALVARTCFDDSTWKEYWAPKVFKRHLREDLAEFDEPHILKYHEEFKHYKKRPDREFWPGLIGAPCPF